MMPKPRVPRRLALLIAAVVAIVTVAVVANATSTITVPNAIVSSYNLASGGFGPAISIPRGRPVLIMGCCLTVGVRGVGHVSALVPDITPFFVEWTGLESITPSGITQGFSSAVGAHILFIDFAHQVDIEVASSSAIRVHNTSAGGRTGNVTLIW
jgi:hypothetical protein